MNLVTANMTILQKNNVFEEYIIASFSLFNIKKGRMSYAWIYPNLFYIDSDRLKELAPLPDSKDIYTLYLGTAIKASYSSTEEDDDHNIDSPSWTDNYEIAHDYALMHALNSSRGTPVIYSVQVAACHVLCFLKDIPDREFLLDLNTAGFGQLYETLDINDDFLVFGSKS